MTRANAVEVLTLCLSNVTSRATGLVRAPRSTVWQLLGPGFARIGDWSTSCPESTPHEVSNADRRAPEPGRRCASTIAGIGGVVERVVVYEPDHHLGYEVVSGLPPFLAAARSDWFLTAEGPVPPEWP
jgi:hypothetical protein